MVRIPLRRLSAVTIALAALLVTVPAASAAPQEIVPVGPDPSFACLPAGVPSLSLRTPRGTIVAPRFQAVVRRLTRQVDTVTRRLKSTSGKRARKRLRAQRQRLAATRAGVKACRAGTLPAAARRTFAFTCLQAFELPTVLIRGTCAVDLRPRGIPDGKARAAYSLTATYGTLDQVLYPECAQEDGAFQGPQRMQDYFGLYLVRCSPSDSDTPLPSSDASTILRMEVENCDEILAADENGCGSSDPQPESDPEPSPRSPPAQPQGDCIILRMEVENADC